MTTPESQLKSAIVRICKDDGQACGAGFLIGESLVITCAHVVNKALDKSEDSQKMPHVMINLDFLIDPRINTQDFYKGRVTFWQPVRSDQSGDIAVLEVIGKIPSDAQPAYLINAESMLGHKFWTCGFPKHNQKGLWVCGEIREQHGTKYIQIENVIQHGFSGGPVWDEKLQAVVGIVVGFIRPEAAYMIPTQLLLVAWPELIEVLFQNLQTNWSVWLAGERERVQENLLLFNCFQNDHMPVADLWRKYTLVPNYSDKVKSPLSRLWQDFINLPAWHEELADKLVRLNDEAATVVGLSALARAIGQINLQTNYRVIRGRLRELIDGQWNTVLSQEIARLERTTGLNCNSLGRGLSRSRSLNEKERELRKLCQLRKDTNRIKEMIDFPAFGRCFLIMGRMGSGKTYFLTTLLSEASPDLLFLPLDPSSYKQETISDLLLANINASGITWPSLESFDSFLEDYNHKSATRHTSPVRLIIIMDDLSKWSSLNKDFIENLIQFVQSHSHLGNFYWLLTIPESYYAELINGPNEDFWMDYGPVKPLAERLGKKRDKKLLREEDTTALLSHIEGWLALEDLNLQAQVGLQLVRQARGTLALDKEPEGSKTARDYLCNPFIAWMWIDLAEQTKKSVERAVTLNYIEFVRNFGRRQTEALQRTNVKIQQEDLHQFVRCVVSFLAHTGSFVYPKLKQDLVKEVIRLAQAEGQSLDQERAELALTSLQRSLLMRIPFERNVVLGDKAIGRIEFKFEIFWEYRLAEQLLDIVKLNGKNQASFFGRLMQSFFSQPHRALLNQLNERLSHFNSEKIRDEILGFYILLLEESGSTNDPPQFGLAAEICSSILKSTTLPKAGIWLAGAWASREVQGSLLKYLSSSHFPGSINRYTLFAIMHFISEVDDVLLIELSIPSRLKLLQPFYKQIAEEKLTPYFKYIVERLFSRLEQDNEIIREMRGLSDCEVIDHQNVNRFSQKPKMEITAKLAKVAVEALYQSARKDIGQLIGKALEYLRSVSEEYSDHRKIPFQEGGWWRYLYREWVIYTVCDYLIGIEDLKSYSILIQQNWYNDSKLTNNACLQLQLEQEASIAIGYLYRHSQRSKHHDYIGFVSDLVKKGSPRDRKNAFYIIYHTIPQGRGGKDGAEIRKGSKKVHIDFKLLLKDLVYDKSLMRSIKYGSPKIDYFLRENVEDWDNLKSELDANTPRRYR